MTFEILTNSHKTRLTAPGQRMSPSDRREHRAPAQSWGMLSCLPAHSNRYGILRDNSKRTGSHTRDCLGPELTAPSWHDGLGGKALTRVGTASGSGSSSSGVRQRMAKERYLSRGRRHVRAMLCGGTRAGRRREQRPPPPL